MTDLLELVKYGDRFQNEVAEKIISQLEDRIGEGLLKVAPKLLCDDRPAIRAATLNVIAGYNLEVEWQTVKEALVLLADDEPLVRRAAIAVLRATGFGPTGQPAIFDLIRCLADSSLENRAAAFEALDEMGGAIDADGYLLIADFLGHEEEGVRSVALELLVTKGQEDLVRAIAPAMS